MKRLINQLIANWWKTIVVNLFLFSNIFSGELVISWNSNIENDLKGYKIYYGGSTGSYNSVVDVGNVNSYALSGLDEGKEYFFSVTAYDSANNESNFSQEVSELVNVIDVTPPKIYAVIATNATELYLTYTENVDKATAENISNYQINNGISISSVVLESNQKSVTIITSPHQEGSYEIVVNSVKDLDQNVIEANSKSGYQYQPEDTTPPTVVDMQILDGTHVDIIFSEPIKKSTAENTGNYNIDQNVSVLQAILDQNNYTVHLVTSQHQSGVNYTLTINNILDSSPQQNKIVQNTIKQYTYYEEDNISPSIYSVNIKTEILVELVFSEDVDKATSEEESNYKINNNITISGASLKDDNRTVQLITSEHQSGGTYTVTVNNVKDLAQSPNSIEANSFKNYSYFPEDRTAPHIVLAEANNETHINVTFSEALNRQTAENEDNYKINNNISIIEAVLDDNQMVVHLVTTAHQSGQTYYLTINNVKDNSPNQNQIVSNSSTQYSYFAQDNNPPQIIKVVIEEDNYVSVHFNEVIDLESAENISNYSISDGIEVFNAMLDYSLKVVYLTTSEHYPSVTYTLTVSNIKDRSANQNVIAANTVFQYYYDASSRPLATRINRDGYQLAYVGISDPYYSDRIYTVSDMPEEISNYLWIVTANDDKNNSEENFLSFQLNEPSKIYVGYDSRATNYPNWLVDNFYKIGKSIGVSEYAKKLDLWEMECDSGMVTLGGNVAAGAEGVECMYVVLIENHDPDRPGMPENMNDPLSMGPANMFLLYQNYPNPFNAGTEIRFQLPKNMYVELTVYNILGQTVKSLVQGHKGAAHHLIRWDGTNEDGLIVPSGMYFSRLVVKKQEMHNDKSIERIVYNDVRKMLMVK